MIAYYIVLAIVGFCAANAMVWGILTVERKWNPTRADLEKGKP